MLVVAIVFKYALQALFVCFDLQHIEVVSRHEATFIRFPKNLAQAKKVATDFTKLSGGEFPPILLSLADCCHVQWEPESENESAYVNRKGRQPV